MRRALLLAPLSGHDWSLILIALVVGIIIGAVLLGLALKKAIEDEIGRWFGWCALICVSLLLAAPLHAATRTHDNPVGMVVLTLLGGLLLLFSGLFAWLAKVAEVAETRERIAAIVVAAVFFVVGSASIYAQRPPGQRIPTPAAPVLVEREVDSPQWHFNDPGQDGSPRYAIDGPATLKCFSSDGKPVKYLGRDSANGAFVFAVPETMAATLRCDTWPTIFIKLEGPLNIGPRDPQPQPAKGRRRPGLPPLPAPQLDTELHAMPTAAVLAQVPSGYEVITNGTSWFIRSIQGLPVAPGYVVVWSKP